MWSDWELPSPKKTIDIVLVKVGFLKRASNDSSLYLPGQNIELVSVVLEIPYNEPHMTFTGRGHHYTPTATLPSHAHEHTHDLNSLSMYMAPRTSN